LDHDGCITCSDAGIPVRVVFVEGDDALCEDGTGNRAQIAVELVAPVQTGDAWRGGHRKGGHAGGGS
jgi:hydrogenase expression/formation protein HypC